MSIVDDIQAPRSMNEIQRAVETVYDAELLDEPVQNGRQRDISVSKNTHFEFQFGGDDTPEVYAYIERCQARAGIEVMLWVDEDWFDDDVFEGFGPSLEDGSDSLKSFADSLLEAVGEPIDATNIPQFESQQRAPPSAVFTALFYL